MAGFFSSDFLCIAHRGASGDAPENTLAAFQRALDLGADAIEFDVHVADGELVVIHDDDLSRTTNGSGSVAGTPLAALRTLDAGDGQLIPLLGEVLDLVGDRMGLNLELKGVGSAGPVVDLLRARGQGPGRILLSAFDHDELHAARAAAPEYPRGALFSRPSPKLLQRARAVDASSVHLPLRHADKQLLAEVQDAGLPVLVYTVNDTRRALALQRLGVAGVFTDHPQALLSALGR